MLFTKTEVEKIPTMSHLQRVALAQRKLKNKITYPKEIYQDIILLLNKIVSNKISIFITINVFYLYVI